METSGSPIGYGPAAQALAARFPRDLPVLVAEPAHAAAALAGAVAYARRGARFFTALTLEEPQATISAQVGASVIAQFATYDERVLAADMIAAGTLEVNHVPIGRHFAIDDRITKCLADFLAMGEATLVRSWTECERIERLLPFRPLEVRRFLPRHSIALQARVEAPDAIVIWAPAAPPFVTQFLAFALEEMRAPIVIVTAEAQGPAALARAQVVLDASFGDPATGVALAAAGVPLVVSRTAGAHEYLDDVTTYIPWDRNSIRSSVQAARSRRAPLLRAVEEGPPPLPAVCAFTVADPAPLVTFAMMTYNRPELLDEALASVFAQTYANVEAVVVNNGGETIEAVVARYPRVRVIELPENNPLCPAWSLAFKAAHGKYVSMLADDDVVLPHYLESMVGVLEATGHAIGYSNILTRYMEKRPGAGFNEIGYQLGYHQGLDLRELLVTNTLNIETILIRTDVFLEYGGFSEALHVGGDFEFLLWASERYEFVFVDRINGLYSLFTEGTNYSVAKKHKAKDDLRYLYAKFPVAGRPEISARRERAIASLDQPSPLQPPLRSS